MTKLEYVAKMSQLVALQTQYVSMAIELGVNKTSVLTEIGKEFDELDNNFKLALDLIDGGSLDGKAKAQA